MADRIVRVRAEAPPVRPVLALFSIVCFVAVVGIWRGLSPRSDAGVAVYAAGVVFRIVALAVLAGAGLLLLLDAVRSWTVVVDDGGVVVTTHVLGFAVRGNRIRREEVRSLVLEYEGTSYLGGVPLWGLRLDRGPAHGKMVVLLSGEEKPMLEREAEGIASILGCAITSGPAACAGEEGDGGGD